MSRAWVEGDLDRLRRITANFFFWQGLRVVPFGLLGLLAAATYAPWWPAEIPAEQALLVGVAAALVGFIVAGRYYDHEYGRVAERNEDHRQRSRLKWFAIYPVMATSLAIDVIVAPALFISGIVWAAAIVLYWASTGRGRLHYLAIAAGTAGLALAPTLGVASAGDGMLPLFFGWFGAAYVVAGLLDHLELRRHLRGARHA
jgi:O-antigen/teichoic acid export membrane protein